MASFVSLRRNWLIEEVQINWRELRWDFNWGNYFYGYIRKERALLLLLLLPQRNSPGTETDNFRTRRRLYESWLTLRIETFCNVSYKTTQATYCRLAARDGEKMCISYDVYVTSANVWPIACFGIRTQAVLIIRNHVTTAYTVYG